MIKTMIWTFEHFIVINIISKHGDCLCDKYAFCTIKIYVWTVFALGSHGQKGFFE